MGDPLMTRAQWRTDLLQRCGGEVEDRVDVSRRMRVTERIARVIGDDIGHDYDECGETQRFYLMVQATMFLDDVIETDGVFPGLEENDE